MTSDADAAAEIAQLKAELAAARAELSGARLLIDQLQAQLAVLKRLQFGRSSEKLEQQITQLELLLEDLEEGEAERVAPAAASPSPGRTSSSSAPTRAASAPRSSTQRSKPPGSMAAIPSSG